MIAWWAHVTLTPEETNTIVFKRGTWKGLKVKIPEGGHTPPNSTAGDNLLWKNAQKNLKKKKTSETINNNIPHRKPNSTMALWNPCAAPSRVISRHHWYITKDKTAKPIINKVISWRWNQDNIPEVKNNPPRDP